MVPLLALIVVGFFAMKLLSGFDGLPWGKKMVFIPDGKSWRVAYKEAKDNRRSIPKWAWAALGLLIGLLVIAGVWMLL